MDCLWSNRAVEKLGKCALVHFRLGCRGALESPAGESHLGVEVLSECLAEAQAKSGGHGDWDCGLVVDMLEWRVVCLIVGIECEDDVTLNRKGGGAKTRSEFRELHFTLELHKSSFIWRESRYIRLDIGIEPIMSGKYVFTKTLKELRFLHCQTSEHSNAVR